MCDIVQEMCDEAKQKGIEQGIEQSSKNIAIEMLKSGELTLSQIARFSKLSTERVKQIANEIGVEVKA